MFYSTNNELYGICDSGWWDYYGTTSNTMVVKLLDANGDMDIEVITFNHKEEFPTQIKVVGDWVYYRYAVLDSYGQETGMHRLARVNLQSRVEEEIFTDDIFSTLGFEVLGYDVSKDNSILYFSALDYSTNSVIVGKIDLSTKAYTAMDADTAFDVIRAF